MVHPCTQKTPACKITWDMDLKVHTCTQELNSAKTFWAAILPGNIYPAGCSAFRGSPACISEVTIFTPETEQVRARNSENTGM